MEFGKQFDGIGRLNSEITALNGSFRRHLVNTKQTILCVVGLVINRGLFWFFNF